MRETVERFMDEIEERINYFRMEYKLEYGEVIMALEIMKLKMAEEMFEDES